MDVGTVAKNKIKICGPEIGHKMNDKSHNFDLIIMELFEIGQLLPKYQLDYYVKLRIFQKKNNGLFFASVSKARMFTLSI